MVSRVSLLLAFLLLPLLSIVAQDQFVEFRVRLTFQDGSAITSAGSTNSQGTPGADSKNRSTGGAQPNIDTMSAMQIRVQVYSDDGSSLEAYPNSEGVAVFRLLGSTVKNGTRVFPAYRVRVSGTEIEEKWAEGVEAGGSDRFLYMELRRKGEKPQPKSSKGMVSAAGLTVPKGAQKELDKGTKALDDNHIEEAKLHFTKAIELYPQFDQAYNNLGVVLMKTGDTVGGRKAFEKALELNDKFARAYVNLAKIELQEKQYEPAILLINKSLSVEPLNAEAISTGCQADLLTSRYEDVVVASRKLHGLPHDGMALCHFAAGVALANLKRPADAVTEYNLYLNEAKPGDALVSKARDAIEELNKQAAADAAR